MARRWGAVVRRARGGARAVARAVARVLARGGGGGGGAARTMNLSRSMFHVWRFQILNLTQISGCVHRWSTSTSLRSQSVRMICTSSFFRPGFQHERSRLLRNSAAHSSSAILGALAWRAPDGVWWWWRWPEPCLCSCVGVPFAAFADGGALLADFGVPGPARGAKRAVLGVGMR